MGVFRQFPYSNFHEMNMDEIIKIIKNMLEEWATYHAEWDQWMSDLEASWTEYQDDVNAQWAAYQNTMNTAWQSMQNFINNYFDNLDVQEEINNKIVSMIQTGEFGLLVNDYIPPAVNAWLNLNITEPEGVVIDTSLTVAGACADAKATGDAIKDLNNATTEFITLQKTANVNELYAPFVHGELNGINIYSATKYRVVTQNIFTPYADVILTADSGFQFGYATCDENGTYIEFSGWLTGPISLPTSNRMRLCIRRETEDVSEIADINEFVSAIKVSTVVDSVKELKWDFDNVATEFITLQKTANVNELYAPFVHGELNGINIYRATKYRIVTQNIFFPYQDVLLTIANGFQIGYATCDENGTFINFSGWLSGSASIPTQHRIRLCIRRETEDVTEIADINEFVSAVKVSTVVDITNRILNTVYSSDKTLNISEIYGSFVNATLNGITLYTSEKYRVSSANITKPNSAYAFKVAEGFRLGWSTCDSDGTFIEFSGWHTGTVIVDTTYDLRFTIARTIDDTSEIADINEFVSAVTLIDNFDRIKEDAPNPILLCERKINNITPYIGAGQSASIFDTNYSMLGGDNYILFSGSANDHSDTALGQIVEITENAMTQHAEFTHNLGHCASADYDLDSNTIIVCDGVYESKTPVITIIEDATNVFVANADIDYADYIQISFANLGYCGNAVFGSDNKTVFLITKQNQSYGAVDVYKFLLGMGLNDFSDEYGTFISGKTDTEYNGTAKLIDHYVSENKLEIGTLQDATYRNGKIYVMTGGPRINGLELCIRDTDFICSDSFAFDQLRKNGDFVTYEPEGCVFIGNNLATWAYHNESFTDMPKGLIIFE